MQKSKDLIISLNNQFNLIRKNAILTRPISCKYMCCIYALQELATISSLYLSYEWFVGLEWEITDGWLETGMEQNRVTVGDGFKVGIFKNMEQEQRKEIDEWKIMVGE